MTILLDSIRALTKLKIRDTPNSLPETAYLEIVRSFKCRNLTCFNLMSSKLIALFIICSAEICMTFISGTFEMLNI